MIKLPTWLLDVAWTPETNGSGYEHLYGHAFGYAIDLEAGSSGRWSATLLNQAAVGHENDLPRAKAAALVYAGSALLLQALAEPAIVTPQAPRNAHD